MVKEEEEYEVDYTKIVIFFGFIGILVLLSITAYWNLQPIEMEVEGQCNTGSFDGEFKGIFMNEGYKQKNDADWNKNNFTKYNTEMLPQFYNLNSVEGIDCQFKFKGKIPKYLFNKMEMIGK